MNSVKSKDRINREKGISLGARCVTERYLTRLLTCIPNIPVLSASRVGDSQGKSRGNRFKTNAPQ